MLEFKQLCDAYEKLSAVEKGIILTDKSVAVMQKLHRLAIPGIDPVTSLAGFIIGSIAADGKINEQEYLLIYPALVRLFGDGFDFNSVKMSFRLAPDVKEKTAEYTEHLLRVLDLLDDELKVDVITLCLCVTAIDGKVSLKEKRYIKRLCNA